MSLTSHELAGKFFTTSATWETPSLRYNLTIPQRVPSENEAHLPAVESTLHWLSILCVSLFPILISGVTAQVNLLHLSSCLKFCFGGNSD